MKCSKFLRAPVLGIVLGSAVCASMAATPARAESSILIDAESGRVLRAENATYPWYPASTTKLMTLYMTLAAIRDQRITPDTLFAVSPAAAAQSPTKMGFPVGTQVTVDNAIKMMMVKSANDMAVVLAEGVGGSVDQFAQQMTETAHRLGMTESNFVNPNGLPDYGQIMSARDLAILARALIHEFPQDSDYWHIPAIKYGRRIVRNYNPLLGRYPGTDGMKTGFVCMSGFNLVATATRDNKQLIAVVLGAPSSSARSVKAAELLEAGFMQGPLAWLTPSLGKVDALASIDTPPPDLTDEMCGRHRKRHATDEEDAGSDSDATQSDPQFSALLSALRAPTAKTLLSDAGPVIPVVVYTGPTRTADQLAKLAAEPAVEPVKKKARHKTAAVAHATDGKKAVAKPKDGKPAVEKSNHKKTDGKVANSKAAGGKTAAAAPWTPMSAAALAASPPPELKAQAPPAAPKPKPAAVDFAQ